MRSRRQDHWLVFGEMGGRGAPLLPSGASAPPLLLLISAGAAFPEASWSETNPLASAFCAVCARIFRWMIEACRSLSCGTTTPGNAVVLLRLDEPRNMFPSSFSPGRAVRRLALARFSSELNGFGAFSKPLFENATPLFPILSLNALLANEIMRGEIHLPSLTSHWSSGSQAEVRMAQSDAQNSS